MVGTALMLEVLREQSAAGAESPTAQLNQAPKDTKNPFANMFGGTTNIDSGEP